MEKPRNIVGPLIRELREKEGLTQSELVARLNLAGWDLSRDIIARIEAQVRWVSDFEVVKLSEAFGMECGKLIQQALAKGLNRPQTLPELLHPPKRSGR